jgi:uncharacterized MAPEG superfamily protein
MPALFQPQEEQMKPELTYLVWVTTLTAVMWIPYILDRMMTWGLLDTVGYPQNPKAQSPWAVRMKAAHANAVENLIVFAALVLTAQLAGVSNNMTVMACMIYFWARVVHFLAYTFRLPWIRTLGFVAGFAAQMMLVWQILAG